MKKKDIVDGLPKGTKCIDCAYMIARIVEPLEEEDIELLEEDESIYLHISCLLLDIDVHDHVVRECSKYGKLEPTNLLIDHRFLGIG